MNNLQNYTAAINNAEMASLVGKNVSASKNTIDVKSDGSANDLSYNLDSAATVTITITDAQGNTVYTANKGSLSAGSYNVGWDGKDSNGNAVAAGTYNCEVQSTGADGTTSTVQTMVQGQVYSLSLADNNPTYVLFGAERNPDTGGGHLRGGSGDFFFLVLRGGVSRAATEFAEPFASSLTEYERYRNII